MYTYSQLHFHRKCRDTRPHVVTLGSSPMWCQTGITNYIKHMLMTSVRGAVFLLLQSAHIRQPEWHRHVGGQTWETFVHFPIDHANASQTMYYICFSFVWACMSRIGHFEKKTTKKRHTVLPTPKNTIKHYKIHTTLQAFLGSSAGKISSAFISRDVAEWSAVRYGTCVCVWRPDEGQAGHLSEPLQRSV